MKRFLTTMMCLLFILTLLGGCGARKNNNTEAGMKIAIVSSPSGVDDGSFNENIYNGILSFVEDNSEASVTPIREESGDVTAAVQAVAGIVADYDVIVCCGYQFSGIGALAQENPDVKFILVDSNPSDASGKEIANGVENIYAMTFREEEAGFLAGLAAALESKTGKVAVVNGIAFPSNVNYQQGFETGVNYANDRYGAKAEIIELASYAGTDSTGKNVGGNYIGNFSDEATGKVVGNALIDKGVDVIFVAAGASGNGVLTAAKEAQDVFCIGSDVDQYDSGANGSNNIMLTSALKVMDMNVQKQLNLIKEGNFQGGNYLLGADSGSTGFVSAAGRHQLSAGTVEKLNEVFEKMKTGEIAPAGR